MVLLDKEYLKYIKKNKVVLLGTQNELDRLWDITINTTLHELKFQLPLTQSGLYKQCVNKISELSTSIVKQKPKQVAKLLQFIKNL